MKTTVRCVPLLVLIVVSGVVHAEQPFDPAARAETIAPFMDEQTIAIGHVDLSRIEVDPLIDKFIELVPEAAIEEDKMRAAARQFHAAFRSNGFTDLYMVVSLADVPQAPPFFILPSTNQSDLDGLLEACPQLKTFAENENRRVEPLDDVLYLGSSRALERIRRGQPDTRLELAEAFRAAGDTAVQLLLLPTADDRRVVEELLPTLPEEVGGGPSTILTRGLLWAAAGVNTPPAFSVQLVIRSEDNAAAQGLRDKLISGARILAQRAKALGALQRLDAAAPLLTPEVEGDRLTLVLNEENRGLTTFLDAVAPPLAKAQARAARARGMNNLKHLGLAMHNWHDVHKSFPAQANFDANGKPLLSWRVHILPYVGQQKLYERFHLDEPWDSEHNRALIEKRPDVYRSPASKKGRHGYTSYVLPVGEETICPGRRGVSLKEITDGTSNTIMIVEVGDDQAVIWTKPEDLPFDPEEPAKGLGGLVEGGFQATFCDGSARFIADSIDPKTLRALFTRAGGEAVSRF